MGLLDFLFGKKKDSKTSVSQSKSAVTSCNSKQTQPVTGTNNLFTSSELKKVIGILSELSDVFRDSVALKQTGGGRNEKMVSLLHSYAGMFCVLFEEYNYGTSSDVLSNAMLNHYVLVAMAMKDANHRKRSVLGLSDNWVDVLTSIQAIKQGGASDGKKFESMEGDIEYVTKAMEKWSGKTCVRPKNIMYNPYGITENASMSVGHSIPDLRAVFAEELLPQLRNARIMGMTEADVTREYVISMIKSYRDNARYVPMCIVDSLCAQIENIANRAGVSFPHDSLKDYVLEKIYK